MSKYNSLFNRLRKCCTEDIRKKSSYRLGSSTNEKFDFNLSKDIENDLMQNKYKHREHPGIMNVPVVTLPDVLSRTIADIKTEKSYHEKLLSKEAFDLATYIFMRQLPFEEGEVQQVAKMITSKLISKGKLSQRFEGSTLESFEDMSKEEKDKFQKHLKGHVYNWHPITYDEFKSFTYLWARMPPDYAALIRIFGEIKKRRPKFEPRFLFDFGSGVGSVMWAAEHIWPNTVKEAYNIDASNDMNNLSEQLFQSGVENNLFQQLKKSNYFRQFLPTSENVKYDLVVSSRSLFEVGNINTRIRTIDILWRKVTPGGFLVVVEAGTMPGYSIIMEIRDYLTEITRIEREKYNYHSPISVFSPCPHDYSCPRFYHKSKSACHFSVAYQALSSFNVSVDKYSYIVFQKENRDEQNEAAWPRIVQPVIRRHQHVITRTCTPSGALRELVATKAKHTTNCYRVCRKCKWGDLLPVDIHKDTIDNSDKNIEYDDTVDSSKGNDESNQFSEVETGEINSVIEKKVS